MNLTQKQFDTLAIGVLTDSIIFDRTYKGVKEILRATNCNQHWQVESYEGWSNIYYLFELSKNDSDDADFINDKLIDTYLETFENDFAKDFEKRKKPKEIAEQILNEWKGLVKIYKLLA